MNHYECLSCHRAYLGKSADRCKNCGSGSAWQRLAGTVELPGFVGTQRAAAAAAAASQGEALSATMRETQRIDFAAGYIEQRSPLFAGLDAAEPQARLF